MAAQPSTTKQTQQLDEQYRLVQAAVDYLEAQLPAAASTTDSEIAAHFRQMRTAAAEHYHHKKLALLKKDFRDIAASALATDSTAFATYIQQATGLPIDVRSDFEKRVAAIRKRRRIRTDDEFYDIKTMIDCLDPQVPAEAEQLHLLYGLTAEYEGFIPAKNIGKPRRKAKPHPGITTEIFKIFSPDGSKVVTATEHLNEVEPEWNRTGLMLNFLNHGSGTGLYHTNQLGIGIIAQWTSNTDLVIRLGKAPYQASYAEKLYYSNGETVNVKFIVEQ